MTSIHSPEIVERLVWDGVTIELRYEPDWCRLSEMGPAHQIAHIIVQVLEPVGAPLPITETGYYSHFIPVGVVEDAGSPAALIRAWLDEEARKPVWRRVEAAWRQLDLFS